MDNFSPHKHPEVRTWSAANQVELVFLPTYASWLNWIEAEFAAVRYFALNGTEHRSHAEQDAAIGDYIHDFHGFLGLAAQVERWFGPMVEDLGFHDAVRRRIRQSTAIVAVSSGPDLLGGLLFATKVQTYHVHWLVVSEQTWGKDVGRALMAEAMRRFVRGPGIVEVVTFGADHPGASVSGARVFYERLGFAPAEAVDPGPEGGSRQVFRLVVTRLMRR